LSRLANHREKLPRPAIITVYSNQRGAINLGKSTKLRGRPLRQIFTPAFVHLPIESGSTGYLTASKRRPEARVVKKNVSMSSPEFRCRYHRLDHSKWSFSTYSVLSLILSSVFLDIVVSCRDRDSFNYTLPWGACQTTRRSSPTMTNFATKTCLLHQKRLTVNTPFFHPLYVRDDAGAAVCVHCGLRCPVARGRSCSTIKDKCQTCGNNPSTHVKAREHATRAERISSR
jgi:hypothetical protein